MESYTNQQLLDLIPRYYYATSYPVTKNRFFSFGTNLRVSIELPQNDQQIEVGNVYIYAVDGFLYWISSRPGLCFSLITNNPELEKANVFQILFGEEYFTAILNQVQFVEPLSEVEKINGYDEVMKFILFDPAQQDRQCFCIKMFKQIKQYYSFVPCLTKDLQIQSKLPDMLQQIGQQPCFGPLILYTQFVLTEKQITQISGAVVVRNFDLLCDQQIRYGIFHDGTHFMTFENTEFQIILYESCRSNSVDHLHDMLQQSNIQKSIIYHSYDAQYDNLSCSLYAIFYYQQLMLAQQITRSWPTFKWVHDINILLLEEK